jgi:hypothetical protein
MSTFQSSTETIITALLILEMTYDILREQGINPIDPRELESLDASYDWVTLCCTREEMVCFAEYGAC